DHSLFKLSLMMIRKVTKVLLFTLLGLLLGFISYEAVMFIRISRLRSENPITTSLIEARVAEAKERGEQPKRMQIWVSLDQISPNLQRAVLAGEDTNFATHNGFDYKAIQKAWDQGFLEAAKEAKKEGENDDWLPNLPD